MEERVYDVCCCGGAHKFWQVELVVQAKTDKHRTLALALATRSRVCEPGAGTKTTIWLLREPRAGRMCVGVGAMENAEGESSRVGGGDKSATSCFGFETCECVTCVIIHTWPGLPSVRHEGSTSHCGAGHEMILSGSGPTGKGACVGHTPVPSLLEAT
jgi:hypothetical protein